MGVRPATSREYYIGVDPDVDKSGVAIVNKRTMTVELLSSLSFPQLIDLLIRKRAENIDAAVVVEAGWLNKGNWHIRWTDNKGQAAAKGYHVGRNHETGMKIIETAEYFGYEVEGIRPLRKCWKGKDRKITAEEFEQLTGYSKRSSQDSRDAGLLALSAAGFPFIMDVKLRQKIWGK